jgi:hypothetical protein
MEMKGKVEEEVRLWKKTCTATKEEANVKAVEMKTMTQYYGDLTHNLFETRKKEK